MHVDRLDAHSREFYPQVQLAIERVAVHGHVSQRKFSSQQGDAQGVGIDAVEVAIERAREQRREYGVRADHVRRSCAARAARATRATRDARENDESKSSLVELGTRRDRTGPTDAAME